MSKETSLEENILQILEQLTVPIEIVPDQACFGRTYYRWWVRVHCRQGIANSFPEALREALNAALVPPSFRAKPVYRIYDDSS
jgi:hypothetical protein